MALDKAIAIGNCAKVKQDNQRSNIGRIGQISQIRMSRHTSDRIAAIQVAFGSSETLWLPVFAGEAEYGKYSYFDIVTDFPTEEPARVQTIELVGLPKPVNKYEPWYSCEYSNIPVGQISGEFKNIRMTRSIEWCSHGIEVKTGDVFQLYEVKGTRILIEKHFSFREKPSQWLCLVEPHEFEVIA